MDREAFKTEVATHMLGLVGQVSTFLHTYSKHEESGLDSPGIKTRLITYADMYATLLEEPSKQELAAETLCAAMFGHEVPPENFWKTEAGRAVALAIGYPRDLVPRPTVAVILGISRQRVGEMIRDYPEAFVETVDEQGKRYLRASDVRAALRARVHR